MSLEQKLKEVLQLVAETGDRVIVLHNDAEPFVIMNVPSYRSLLRAAAERQNVSQLNEHELLDSINQQIAEWRENRGRVMRDYDLEQFVPATPSAPTTSPHPTPEKGPTEQPLSTLAAIHTNYPKQADEVKVINLPTIEPEHTSGYQLEPLS